MGSKGAQQNAEKQGMIVTVDAERLRVERGTAVTGNLQGI